MLKLIVCPTYFQKVKFTAYHLKIKNCFFLYIMTSKKYLKILKNILR